jgi:transketolase
MEFSKDKLATRGAGKEVMAAFADFVPTMVGGAADLSESTKTEFPGGPDARFETAAKPDRNVFWGVREHGMGGAVNGWPPTAASSAPTARRSCSSRTTCAARSA